MTEVWVHRGAFGYAPENTLEAFVLAAEMGANGAELDVQMSRDGYLVMAHDERIDRVSNGSGFIRDFILEELKGSLFSKTHPEYKDTRIPALREVYELLKDTPLEINVELKNGIYLYEGPEEWALDLTDRLGMVKRVVYSSFNHNSVAFIKHIRPDAVTSVLYSDGIYGPAAYAQAIGADALRPTSYNLRYPGAMEQAGERGLKAYVWTVNIQEQGRECLKAGVDTIINNYPDRMKELL